MTPPKVAIIGAGITGLSAALRLAELREDVRIDVFDAAPRAGGLICTEHRDGFLIERGPDSFITNKPDAIALCESLGIADRLISTCREHRRSLVLHRGKPYPVPEGFMLMAPSSMKAILTSPILSVRGKLRLLAEAFVPARRDGVEESLSEFVTRRFGREALERLVQPLVGGIYTSDPKRLSLRATLPRFVDMERDYGSVIRAVRRQQRGAASSGDTAAEGSGARYGLFATHEQGLGAVVDACLDACRARGTIQVHLGCRVNSVRPDAAGPSGWLVATASGSPITRYDAVIITLPAHHAASVLQDDRLSGLTAALQPFRYASSAIVVSGHRLDSFRHPLDAFGLVIPEIEHRDILAVSFSSRKFPHRAPEGHVLLRTFVGGDMHPELLERSDAAIEEPVRRELQSILGMSVPPVFMETVRYLQAMPQYDIGHEARVAAMRSELASLSGLELAGSTWDGVGIPDSIRSGRAAAARIATL